MFILMPSTSEAIVVSVYVPPSDFGARFAQLCSKSHVAVTSCATGSSPPSVSITSLVMKRFVPVWARVRESVVLPAALSGTVSWIVLGSVPRFWSAADASEVSILTNSRPGLSLVSVRTCSLPFSNLMRAPDFLSAASLFLYAVMLILSPAFRALSRVIVIKFVVKVAFPLRRRTW